MKNKNAMPVGRQGFTLFELLVSISIIGILVAIVSISYSSAQKKARDVRRMEDMGNIQKAAEQFYSVAGYSYPTKMDLVGDFTANGQAMLQLIPKDPKTGDLNWTKYVYTAVGSGYCACARMDNILGGNSDGTANLTCGVGAGTSYYCVKNQQ